METIKDSSTDTERNYDQESITENEGNIDTTFDRTAEEDVNISVGIKSTTEEKEMNPNTTKESTAEEDINTSKEKTTEEEINVNTCQKTTTEKEITTNITQSKKIWDGIVFKEKSIDSPTETNEQICLIKEYSCVDENNSRNCAATIETSRNEQTSTNLENLIIGENGDIVEPKVTEMETEETKVLSEKNLADEVKLSISPETTFEEDTLKTCENISQNILEEAISKKERCDLNEFALRRNCLRGVTEINLQLERIEREYLRHTVDVQMDKMSKSWNPFQPSYFISEQDDKSFTAPLPSSTLTQGQVSQVSAEGAPHVKVPTRQIYDNEPINIANDISDGEPNNAIKENVKNAIKSVNDDLEISISTKSRKRKLVNPKTVLESNNETTFTITDHQQQPEDVRHYLKGEYIRQWCKEENVSKQQQSNVCQNQQNDEFQLQQQQQDIYQPQQNEDEIRRWQQQPEPWYESPPVICDICGETVLKNRFYSRHIKTHGIMTKAEYDSRHPEISNKEESWLCRVCPSSGSRKVPWTKISISAHLRLRHKMSPAEYQRDYMKTEEDIKMFYAQGDLVQIQGLESMLVLNGEIAQVFSLLDNCRAQVGLSHGSQTYSVKLDKLIVPYFVENFSEKMYNLCEFWPPFAEKVGSSTCVKVSPVVGWPKNFGDEKRFLKDKKGWKDPDILGCVKSKLMPTTAFKMYYDQGEVEAPINRWAHNISGQINNMGIWKMQDPRNGVRGTCILVCSSSTEEKLSLEQFRDIIYDAYSTAKIREKSFNDVCNELF